MASTDYDVWLFDLDGTVIDVDPAHSRRVFDEVGARPLRDRRLVRRCRLL
jgi:phosphoglycolate phosphatase